jgi:hypothetical protein
VSPWRRPRAPTAPRVSQRNCESRSQSEAVCALCNTASLQLQRQLAVGLWKKWSGKINSVLIGMLCAVELLVPRALSLSRSWSVGRSSAGRGVPTQTRAEGTREAPRAVRLLPACLPACHSSRRAACVWIFQQENQNLYALPERAPVRERAGSALLMYTGLPALRGPLTHIARDPGVQLKGACTHSLHMLQVA